MRSLVIILALAGCVKLDGFAFQTIVVDSLEDYHNLPLYQGSSAPEWINESSAERELYISGDGELLDPSSLPEEYIHAVFIPAPQDCPAEECPLAGQDVTFLYQHGNSGHLFRYWYRAISLWDLGANVLIYTYRGFGLSKGEPSKQSILEDSLAAARYVFSRDDVEPSKVFAYGYSMGAIPTSYLVGDSAVKDDFAGVILESGLDSIEETLDLSVGTEMSGFFFKDTVFDGPVFMEGATLPILHIHGALDSRVLPSQAANYNDVLFDQPEYTAWLGDSGEGPDLWLAESAHRNIPINTFKGEYHIADYWDEPTNPDHCCIHPLELEDLSDESEQFLDETGKTNGEELAEAAAAYQELISSWVLEQVD